MNARKTALVVLSGGQDSTTSLFWATYEFEAVRAVTFDYGQLHDNEISAAHNVARQAGIPSPETITIDRLAGRSPLTNPAHELETYESPEEMAATIGDRVELTFVPMRNAIFLAMAANWAIAHGIYDLVTGVCQEDNANYPDCRQAFIWATEHMTNLALGLDRSGVRFQIHTPLMNRSKADTVLMACNIPGCYEALAWSHTAYSGEYPPKTQDHATVLRAKGFADAKVPDPLILRAWLEGALDELPKTGNYDCLRMLMTIETMPSPTRRIDADRYLKNHVPQCTRDFLNKHACNLWGRNEKMPSWVHVPDIMF